VALTAWGLHVVVERWTGLATAGVLAACALLTTPWLFGWALGVPQYAVLSCFPWIALLASDRSAGWRRVLMLVPLIVLQSLAEPVYVAPAVFVPIGLIALGRLWHHASRPAGVRLVVALALSVLLLLPLYVGYARVRAANPQLDEQSLWSAGFPHAMFVPPLELGWNGLVWRDPTMTNHGPSEASAVMLVLIVAGLACLLLGRSRSTSPRTGWAHGLLWSGVGIMLSCPAIVIFGRATVHLPLYQAALHWTPGLFNVVRVPQRYGVATLIGLAMLTGVGFAQCVGTLPRRIPRPAVTAFLAAIAAVAMYVERRPQLQTPFPVISAAPYRSSLLDAVRRTEGPLLELPVVGVPNELPDIRSRYQFAEAHARAMCRSIFHWRPILNGYSSYWPVGFPERMALAMQLPDPNALESLRRLSGLRSILVRLPELSPADQRTWLRLAESRDRPDLVLVARDQDELLFDVTAAAASTTRGE